MDDALASALGKDVSLELNDKEEPMSNVYSLRIYDTELMRFSMEKQGLSGLVAEILYTNEAIFKIISSVGFCVPLSRRLIPERWIPSRLASSAWEMPCSRRASTSWDMIFCRFRSFDRFSLLQIVIIYVNIKAVR